MERPRTTVMPKDGMRCERSCAVLIPVRARAAGERNGIPMIVYAGLQTGPEGDARGVVREQSGRPRGLKGGSGGVLV